MRALSMSLVVLILAVFSASGCADCPIHKALFGSDEDDAAPESIEAEGQAALDAVVARPVGQA